MKAESILISLLVSLVATVLVIFLSHSDFFDNYELKSFDWFQKLNSSLEDPEVAIVEIDQRSLTKLSAQGIRWPWPRQIYAPIAEVCSKAGAKGIIFDMVFSEPSSYGRDDDLEFAGAIKRTRNVFLPMSMSSNEENETDITPIRPFGIRGDVSKRLFREAKSYVSPVEELAAGAKGLGDVLIPPDRDGVYRRVSLFTRYQGYLFPSLGVAPVMQRFRFGEKDILFNGKSLFLNRRGEFVLHYYGEDFRFPRLNVLELISAYQNPGSPSFDQVAMRIRDRFVIVALTAPGLYDLKPTAVTAVSPGAYVHGVLLSNLLRGDHVRDLNDIWRFILIFVLGTALGFSVVRVSSFWKISLIFILFVFGCSVISLILFHSYQYWIGLLSYQVALFFVLGVTSTYSYHTEGRKRKMIRRLFSHYMSEVLIKELEANPQKAALGGERRFITIFFSDLADFTSVSEQSEPEKIVSLLNVYLTEMSGIILDLQGIIDKYQGDGIMAFWGAPIPVRNHAVMACLAALDCQHTMEKINERLRHEGLPPWSMRIGLHSGDAIVGNMGSEQRFDYTIIGDSVNLASRLEGVNKEFGTGIVVSEVTYRLAKDQVEARELDLITVKGREKPVKIFELMGEKEKITEDKKRLKLLFEDGLRLYKERDFERAQKIFEQVLKTDEKDRPAQLFIKRCVYLGKKPPPADWDGVFRGSGL